MKQLKTRNEFPGLLKEMRLVGKAVELGVAEGIYSYHLLDHWPGTLYQVDPWRLLDTPGFTGHGEDTDAGQEARYQRIVKAAARYGGRCIPIRATSDEAAKLFKPGFFQFIYADANHRLESIRKDIETWWPLLQKRGVMAGHDHVDGLIHGTEYGVKTAVAEFASKHGLTVNVTLEPDYPSWWFVK